VSPARIKAGDQAPNDDLNPTGAPAGLDEVLATRVAERFVSSTD
jgi:hypothetical protein